MASPGEHGEPTPARSWDSLLAWFPEAALLCDAGGRIRAANDAARELVAEADPVGRRLFDVVRIEDPAYAGAWPPETEEASLTARVGAEPVVLRVQTRGAGEDERTIVSLRRLDGTTETVERAVSLLEATLDATADGILVVDLDGSIVTWNQAFQQMWNVPGDLLAERDDEKLLSFVADQLEDPDSFLDNVREVYQDPETESFDVLRFEDGRCFHRYSKPQRVGGQVVGRVWSFRDVTDQERIEKRLRRSEQQFRSLFENVPIGIYRTTPDGRILLANPWLVDMLGYESAEEMATRNLEADTEFFEPDYSREKFRRQLEEDGEVRGIEARWIREDGSEIYVRESARAVRDEQGDILYYEGTVEDISERREYERRLRRMARFPEENPNPILEVTAEGEVTYRNPPARERLAELTHLEPDSPIRAAVDHLLDAAQEGREIDDQGEVSVDDATFEWKAYTLPDEGSLRLYLHDVTDRVEAKQALRESEQRLQTVVSEAPILLLTLNPDGRVRFVTGTGLQELGLTADELEGRRPQEMDALDEDARRSIEHALEGHHAQTLAHIDDRWAQIQLSPVRDEDGEVESVIAVAIDVTDRKEAENEVRRLNENLEQIVEERTAELEAANRELKAFSYSVSHDLRAPLQTIDGFSQILLESRSEELGEEGRHLLSRIRRASQTMGDRIDALLTLSRVTRHELNPDRLDLSDMAREILTELHERNPERSIEWEVEDDMRATGDPSLVRAMLDNLIRNAWKFTREEDPARIQVYRAEGDENAFVVEDNGEGFDPAHADELFQPFERLDEDVEGTGIGLATVERIVRRHNGAIEADGEPGEGACFTFVLPEETDE
jgi:PAS domain S-box-containing protein